jgi:GWxTD domain-containing protein
MSMTLLIPVLLAAGLAGNPAQDSLRIVMYRTLYPPDVTVVDGLFRVDGAMLGTGPACAYHVTLTVVDSSGTQLVKNEWDGACPPPRDGQPMGALETFQFAVVPSTYTVQVAVEPKGSPQNRILAKAGLESLASAILASDLILGRRVGWVDSSSTGQYSIRRGKLGIAAASEVVAQESSPSIAYYLEVYASADRPLSGKLFGVILRPDGRQMARLELHTLDAVAQSMPLAGNMSVEGLASGEYVLETRLELGDTVLVRTHPFSMQGKTFAQPQPAAVGGYFASLSPQDLARLFDPVVMTLTRKTERDLYAGLNADGRRRFLQRYFGGVEPTPGGEGENPLDLYLKRVEHVNREYAGRGGEEGWRTDRGRIYMLRGAPNNRVARPLPPEGAAPYEIWQYTAAPGYVFAFVDEARIGSYRLIYTTDPNEPSLPDWERRLATEAVEEMIRMGARPVIRGAGPDGQ